MTEQQILFAAHCMEVASIVAEIEGMKATNVYVQVHQGEPHYMETHFQSKASEIRQIKHKMLAFIKEGAIQE